MGKKKTNIKESRYEFNLQDFFVKKLLFKKGTLYFGSNTKLSDVSKILGIDPKKALIDSGLNKNNNINHILNDDQIARIAIKNNFNFEKVDDISEINVVEKIQKIMEDKDWTKISEVIIKERAPIITIMGHVDHGKTTLLDIIRKSNLTTKEVGGITQTIGAYQIKAKNKKITFIDTPGHEAFSEMRANGSKITDIAIIVVAANESIMPQTKESIDHVKAAGVPIIIAVNKMDVVGADLKKIKNDFSKLGILAEDWGGKVPFVPISALKGEGIDILLETILLVSELLELKSPENILASGTVIESNIHKQKGNMVSVIVQNGTLKVGDTIIIDDFIARVKALHNDQGKNIEQATPGTPVEIFGVGKAPLVGSKFVVSKNKFDQKIVNEIHEARLNKLREKPSVSAADLFINLKNSKKTFNIILKADSLGVLKAISNKIIKMESDDIKINIIREDIGEITNTDIALADASKAIIYTFNTKVSPQIQSLIKNKGINIFSFDIIYKLFEDIEFKINGMNKKQFIEKEIGKAEVIKLFTFSKIGTIIGSAVIDGIIKRNSLVDIKRKEKVIFSSSIESLRVEKDQVKEVSKGREFGVVVKGLNIEVKPGDILIAKELSELK